MSVLSTGLWKQPVNTKIPAINHLLSFRATYTTLAAGANTNLDLPANYVNPGQLSAPTATPYDVNSEPQTIGQRLVVTRMQIRDTSGLNTGASGAGSITLAVANSSGGWTSSDLFLAVAANTPAGAFGYAEPTAALAAGSTRVALIFPGQAQQPFRFVYVGGTGSTAGLSAAFTVDVFGYWIPVI